MYVQCFKNIMAILNILMKIYFVWTMILQAFNILAYWFIMLPIENLIKYLRVEFGMFTISLYAKCFTVLKTVKMGKLKT